MSEPKFRDFLDNPVTYQQCLDFWLNLLEDLASECGSGGRWMPYGHYIWGNGQPFLDGDPIVSVWHKISGKGIRVVQSRLVDDAGEIAAWVTQDDIEPTIPRYDLTIALSLTERTRAVSEDLIRKWMRHETDVPSMRAFIADSMKNQAGSGHANGFEP